ncbi:MAG: hypothetical protein IIC13_01500 [SAR324 cluster bacterium]|nr:hypothetical protein [SAR324 cluster bacterium]
MMAIRISFHLFFQETKLLQRMKPAAEQGIWESIMACPRNGGGQGGGQGGGFRGKAAAAPPRRLAAESAAMRSPPGGIVP